MHEGCQHVINTADFPFYDVDNVATDSPHVPGEALWYSSNMDGVEADLAVIEKKEKREPKGAMVSSVLSAFACYAGSENQPPRFVANLDTKPEQGGYIAPDAGRFAVETEHTCYAGELCVLPLFAQDFNMHANGCSNPDSSDACSASALRRPASGPLLTRASNCASADFPGPPDAKFQSCDVVQVYPLTHSLLGLARAWARACLPRERARRGAHRVFAAHPSCRTQAAAQCCDHSHAPALSRWRWRRDGTMAARSWWWRTASTITTHSATQTATVQARPAQGPTPLRRYTTPPRACAKAMTGGRSCVDIVAPLLTLWLLSARFLPCVCGRRLVWCV